MKPTNLYDIYRQVKARNKNIKSDSTQQLCARMIEAAESIVDKPTLSKVNEFRKAENDWLEAYDVRAKVNFAGRFEKAIRSKNFISERSHYDPKGKHSQVESGVVYCVKSSSKPGQLKLGWSGDLRVRLQKLEGKHKLLDAKPLFAISAGYPAKIEFDAKKKLRAFLVSGCSDGDSIEWYKITAVEFARLLVDTIVDSEHLNSVKDITLYPWCTNEKNVSVVLSQLGVSVNRQPWL